jgi:hypothetical protein
MGQWKLSPAIPHHAHILTDSMLLHWTPHSLRMDELGVSLANICKLCFSDIHRDKTPLLSLANGMWIGDVPLELKVLTLPKRIFVVSYLPVAYIVKLCPRKKGAQN